MWTFLSTGSEVVMQTKFTYLKLSVFEISILQKVIFVRQITTRVFLYRGPHVKNEHIF